MNPQVKDNWQRLIFVGSIPFHRVNFVRCESVLHSTGRTLFDRERQAPKEKEHACVNCHYQL